MNSAADSYLSFASSVAVVESEKLPAVKTGSLIVKFELAAAAESEQVTDVLVAEAAAAIC